MKAWGLQQYTNISLTGNKILSRCTCQICWWDISEFDTTKLIMNVIALKFNDRYNSAKFHCGDELAFYLWMAIGARSIANCFAGAVPNAWHKCHTLHYHNDTDDRLHLGNIQILHIDLHTNICICVCACVEYLIPIDTLCKRGVGTTLITVALLYAMSDKLLQWAKH